jgi:hypothetical protein
VTDDAAIDGGRLSHIISRVKRIGIGTSKSLFDGWAAVKARCYWANMFMRFLNGWKS